MSKVNGKSLLVIACLMCLVPVLPVLGDAASDASDAAADVATANQNAADNIPTSRVCKNAEDNLDRAARAADDAQATNEAVKNNENSTPQQKTNAQNAYDRAVAARNAAETAADNARTSTQNPDRAQRYREALAQRREARMRLKVAADQLRRALGGERRYGLNSDRERAVEQAHNRARQALRDAERVVTAEESGSGSKKVARKDHRGKLRDTVRESVSVREIATKDIPRVSPSCGH